MAFYTVELNIGIFRVYLTRLFTRMIGYIYIYMYIWYIYIDVIVMYIMYIFPYSYLKVPIGIYPTTTLRYTTCCGRAGSCVGKKNIFSRSTRVIACETTGANCLAESLAAQKLVTWLRHKNTRAVEGLGSYQIDYANYRRIMQLYINIYIYIQMIIQIQYNKCEFANTMKHNQTQHCGH